MQPCSQPWYGLIDCVNGMSGESLRAMIVRAGWIVTTVLGVCGASASASAVDQPSSNASRCGPSAVLPVCPILHLHAVSAASSVIVALSTFDTGQFAFA